MKINKSWDSRPPDAANLFNPAFCSLLLNRMSFGYTSKAHEEFPYPLAFVAMPMLLHPATTDALPRTSGTNFHGWLLNHSSLLVGFPERASALAPAVREAISFSLSHNLLAFGDRGGLVAIGRAKKIREWEQSAYNSRYSKDAQLIGKLFAQIEDVTTIFALFGVRP